MDVPNMTQWQVLIVDDEAPARFNLESALTDHQHWHLVGSCDSVQAASALLADRMVDLVFLDVQMPRENGFVLAKALSQLEEPPLVIFVTAYDRYALQAFDVHALDYLLKPFDNQRFAVSLQRAEALLSQRQKRAYGDALRSYVDETEQPPTSNRPRSPRSGRSAQPPTGPADDSPKQAHGARRPRARFQATRAVKAWPFTRSRR